MLTGLHGIDIITPGTSTVGYVQDFDTDSFGRFQFALNTASINAFYVWIAFTPNARFRIGMSWLTSLHSARRRLPTRYHERTRLTATTAVWLYNPAAKVRKFIEKR